MNQFDIAGPRIPAACAPESELFALTDVLHEVGTLELAVRRLTFDSATAFGIYDRGLVQPGMAADLVVFDPDTVQPVTEDVVHDFPNNGWRMRELAEGIHYTVVNGEVLLEKGTHTGSYPGRVLHNARYHGTHNGRG